MKLFQFTTLALATSEKTIDVARKTFGHKICGKLTGSSGHLADDIELRKNESCIFRIKPEQRKNETNHIHLTLIEAAKIDCNEGQIHIVMGDEIFGPYCTEVNHETGDRHRRGLWSSSSGMDMPANKEIDMVYSRTSGGGFKFRFAFEFEFELLPGLPGAGAQEDLAAQLGPYYKPTKAPTPAPTTRYTTKKTTKATTKATTTTTTTTTKRTTTTKYTTTRPTTKYTTKPTTKYTTKATTKYTTAAPTTKYTTKTTTEEYDFFWEPDHSKYVSFPGPFNTAQYCPHHAGTWYYGYNPDCEIGVCNTKYFGRCWNNVYNRIYTEICPAYRKQAKAAHTDIMNFFIELGVRWSEKRNKACEVNIKGFLSQGIRGTIYEPIEDSYDRSLYHVGELPLDEDDYEYYDSIGVSRHRRYDEQPACSVRAGVHKCNAVNYEEIENSEKYLERIFTRITKVGEQACNKAWTTMMMEKFDTLNTAVNCGKPKHFVHTWVSGYNKVTNNKY